MDSFSQGLEGLCTVSSSVLHGIEPRLKDFHQLLLSPPKVGDPEWDEAAAPPLPTGGVPHPGGRTSRQTPGARVCPLSCPVTSSALTPGLGVEQFVAPAHMTLVL